LLIHATALLAVDVQNLAAAEFNSPVHKALFTHVSLRIAEIVLGGWAFRRHVMRDRTEEADLFNQLSNRNKHE
jgi:hypothetical protein